MKAMSLGYHDVTDNSKGALQGHRALYKLDREDFRKHMQCIRDRGQAATVRAIDRIEEWKENEAPAFLTFDDGELGSYDSVAPELELHGWRGHFFITTDWIGRDGFMDRAQIRELRQRGHVIGSHSCTHPSRMSILTPEQLRKEWSESCAILSDIMGEKTRVASIPDGYYSKEVARAAAASGIEVLFTSEATASTWIVDGCLVLGRYFIQIHTPPVISGAIAAGATWPRLKQTLLWELKRPVKAVAGETYFTIRRYLISQVLR
jgi:hypothetical protein